MCGIAGYLNLNHQLIKDSSMVRRMLHVQRHRGPDDSGIRAFNLIKGNSLELPVRESVDVGAFDGILGFNRLSILDLSLNGHQPMVSSDQQVMLVMNGEIYNAFDHKKGLVSEGYSFKSTTDTEVVLNLYLKHGFEGMLSRLNGMFAIVLIDLRKRLLFIARDRFGIKPMYYISKQNLLAFSSEIKSFKYVSDFRFELDEKQLDEYLLFRHNIRGTLFEGIQSLEPGHYLSFNHERGLCKYKYFDINDYSREKNTHNNSHYLEEKLEHLLDKSVKSQLMSDVKLGCQLSGGVDSSMVTYFANKANCSMPFESVSIIFNEPQFSEETYIDRVASQLNIPAHKFLLDADYYLKNIEKAIWHFESPINHPNTIGIFLLAQKARDYVTVLLSGEGADEVFGGYRRFYNIKYFYHPRQLLGELKRNITSPGNFLDYFSPQQRAVMPTAFMKTESAKALKPDFSPNHAKANRKLLYKSLTGSVFDRQVKYEILTYLPDLLIRQDKMSMAHSIENRVPFLDNEVVAGSFSIPEEYLVPRRVPEGNSTGKYLLKKISARIFGADIAFRDKMGFGIPLKTFFSNPVFLQYINEQVLPGIKQRGIFNYSVVAGWINNLSTLNYQKMDSLWIALSFEIWASTYLGPSHDYWNTPY